MITLRDLNYCTNKVEMILSFHDKVFDGEIYKSIVDITFKFGMQCSEKSYGGVTEFPQEIHQEILWTENDINRLSEQITYIFNTNGTKDIEYYGIALYEQEFEALCSFSSPDFVSLFISVGISSVGSAIRLTTTRDAFVRWVNEIRDNFYGSKDQPNP